MGQSGNIGQTLKKCEFLPRDILSHPLAHSPDINTLDSYYLRQVELTVMDHPASFVEINQHIHERDIQPFAGIDGAGYFRLSLMDRIRAVVRNCVRTTVFAGRFYLSVACRVRSERPYVPVP